MEASLLRDRTPSFAPSWQAPIDPPPKRTRFETAEKSAAAGLKFAGQFIRTIGFTGVGQTMKNLEIFINTMVVKQDFLSGRTHYKLNGGGADNRLAVIRDFIAGMRDLVQLANIPCGMIKNYAIQVRDYGQFDIFVNPFAKDVVNTFRDEARALLLVWQVLDLGVQLQEEKKDYARITGSIGTTVSIAASFLGFEQVGLTLGLISMTFSGAVFLRRQIKQYLRGAPKKAYYDIQISQHAANKLRYEFLTQLNQEFLRIEENLFRQPEFNNDKMHRQIQSHFTEIHGQMQTVSNEHGVANTLKDHCTFLEQLDQQGILPIGMLAEAKKAKATAELHSAGAMGSEQRAVDDLLAHEHYLQSQLSVLKAWQLTLKDRKNYAPAQKQNTEVQKIIVKFEAELEEISRIHTDDVVHNKNFRPDLLIVDREKIYATLTRCVSRSRYAYYEKKIQRIQNLGLKR
ncbi:MAG: hypothetical protein Q8K75_06135 [Chlamydiales bacterium]|nr:hypothetical protein [Chlamydiales bacterium]